MNEKSTAHPVISEIRTTMVSEGYPLFEKYEQEIERFTEGLVDSTVFRQQNIEWASRNLQDIENMLTSGASGTFRPLLAEVDAFGEVREFVKRNGGLDTLTRQSTAMFSLEIEDGRYNTSNFQAVSAADARKTQGTIFKDAGYAVNKREGYSFFEYGRKTGGFSPFRIYFSPFNLKKSLSRMSANLVYRTASDRELIIIPHACLFPCLSHYQLFNTDLAAIYRIGTIKLLEDRTRLHIRLLEMLMEHLGQFIDNKKQRPL